MPDSASGKSAHCYVGTRPSTMIINIGTIIILNVVIRASIFISDMNLRSDFSGNIDYSNYHMNTMPLTWERLH